MSLGNALLRLVKGSPEQQAVEAGEVDAIIDYASSNVILLPAARRALREREAANELSLGNSLLAALPRAEYRRLHAGLVPVTLKFGQVLCEPGAPIRHVYFPVDSVISLVAKVKGYAAAAVGLVGREGVVGIPLALGIDFSPTRAVVHASGRAMRMEAAGFRSEFLRSEPFRQALYRYKHALVGQMAQSSVCSRFHLTQARLARYLLMTRDGARSSEFRLSHEFLGDMLGVRRVAVTNAAGALQKLKLIRYSHGKISLLDRRGLNAVVCGCYKIIKKLYADARRSAL